MKTKFFKRIAAVVTLAFVLVAAPCSFVQPLEVEASIFHKETIDSEPSEVYFYSASLLGQYQHLVLFNNAEDVDGYEIKMRDALGKHYTFTVKENGQEKTLYRTGAVKRTVKHVEVRAYRVVDGKKVYSKWVKGSELELPL